MKVFALAAVLLLAVSATMTGQKAKSAGDKKPTQNPQYIITVSQGGKVLGDIKIELYPDVAPKHVANFDSLVSIKFFDGTAFHRVIPGFMIQGGDPNSKDKPKETWGQGAPGQKMISAEFNDISHTRGVISAARRPDPNSATSQFFICVADAKFLDHQYTAFGRVLSGMEIADKVVSTPRDARDNPLEKVEMKIVKVGAAKSKM